MIAIPGLPAGVQVGMQPGGQPIVPVGGIGPGGFVPGMPSGAGLGASVGMTATGFAPLPGGIVGAIPGMPGAGQPGSGQQFGVAIAGVASTKEGPSMKVYNGRESYNEWEFVYDFRRDPMMMRGMQPGVPGQPGAPGQPTGFGSQPTGFGPTQPGFGQPGFGQPGGFGQSQPGGLGQPPMGDFGRPPIPPPPPPRR